ncbi:unnamed protein product [Cylindrotheca closterium]|uniref:BING4 C-terminal domain-containing protein n=1 Tax=Cylindrotheca closterium TaxID=2856 RepID=A0AAD2FQ94_9STRA|nr:unnamed protein product [Cylindrotheca closterium]
MTEGTEESTDERTSSIARGMTTKEAGRVQHNLQTAKRSHSEDKALLSKYKDKVPQTALDSVAITTSEHLEHISKSKKLNDYQKRSMQKRVQYRRKDKVIQARVKVHKTKRYQAAISAADAHLILNTQSAGLVEAEHDMERTTSLSQHELKHHHLDQQTSRQIYDLTLPHSPYGLKYDRSGRYSLLYGQRGHLAIMDATHLQLHRELHIQERIRDVSFLHNYTMMAVAQTNHVYIYDDQGTEIHKLNDMNDPFAIDFLPYHWLLTCVGRSGHLKYLDTSTGQLVSTHNTKLAGHNVLRQNPSNAVMHLGHANGTVSLWSPASSQFLAKLHCHKGAAVTSMAIDLSGNYMVTGGADRQVHIWDIRKFRKTHSYFTPAGVPQSLDLSQRNVMGIGHATHATFWSPEALLRKVKDPYMHHSVHGCGAVETLRFRPFEDVCGLGHGKGVSSIVIPGSGEPNLDTTEANLDPNQDKKQRREAEVRALLDKLQPNMITMDPADIGGVEDSSPEIRQQRLESLEATANAKNDARKKKQKSKKRGRSKIQTKLRRKSQNIIDHQIVKQREQKEEVEKKAKEEARQSSGESKPKSATPALQRFF